MKKNKALNIISIIAIVLFVAAGAICTSLYSKRKMPSLNSKIDYNFNMNMWKFDEKNNVYYQIGVDYCEKSKINDNQKFNIYVPGEYLTAKKNSDDTYSCKLNEKGKKAGYNIKSAPIIIAIQSEEATEQTILFNYNYEPISNYIEEGYIYILPGMRGLKENQKDASDEEYSNAIIDGITDLKALVRFCRFNDARLPGNVEKIIAYGINGGGTKSAILGASGDSELYSPKLLAIGAIMVNDEGKRISDSVNGTMCCSPTKSIEINNKAYNWCIKQYYNQDDTEKQNRVKDLAIEYADYINSMKLKSEDGSLLYLNESEQDIYAKGTYYNYLLAEMENSINLFLQNTSFPYTNPEKNLTYATAKEYVELLNVNVRWIEYDEGTNKVKINSIKDFANNYRNKLNKIEDKICLNEYNPYYYLSNKYNGVQSSYKSRYWNICTLIDDQNINFLPEENLKLILEKNEEIRKIKYSCIWVNDYSSTEKNRIIIKNLNTWVKSLS